jgi:hypothetical protein
MTVKRSRFFNFSAQSKIDFGLLFTLVMCLFAVLPIAAHPGLFVGHDTLNHAFRVGEVSRLWSQGILFPRWAETFYFGYGSPVFQYYAPLTYTLSVGFMKVFGLDALGALRLLVIVCLPMTGAGMYLFMRGQAGKLAGIVAALVYVYSPYIVFTEPITRGDYPEMLCFALFPFVMWRIEAVLQHGRGRDVAVAALVIGIFALAHNLMSALLFALLIGWLIWRKLTQSIDWRQLRLGIIAAFLGIGLAAYFWLPIILERNDVQLGNVPINIQSEQENLFGFFVPLDRLLMPSPLEDAGAQNGTLLRLNLGAAQWILALSGVAGITVLWWRNRRLLEARTRHVVSLQNVLFFVIVSVGMILLILPLAYGLWTSFKPLNFMEFPWRLLGPLAFCLAVLAGMNAVWIERIPKQMGNILAVGMIVLVVIAALPTLYVPAERLHDLDTSPTGYLQSETSGRTSPGTSARNDFLPYAVKVLPFPTQMLLDEFVDGGAVDKVNPNSIAPSSAVTVIEHTPQSDTWQVLANVPFTVEIMTFYIPAWHAEVDRQPVAITPIKPHGFMHVDVPAGDHTLRVFLAETPARILGIVVSLLTIAGIGIGGLRIHLKSIIARLNKPKTIPLATLLQPSPVPSCLSGDFRYAIALGIRVYAAALVITLVGVAVFMREGSAWLNSPPGTAQIAQHQTDYHLGDDIQVVGYAVSSDSIRPGDWLEVVVYWYANGTPDYNYNSFLHFSTSDGVPLAQADKSLPTGNLTSEWHPGAYRRDEYSLHIPYETSPGEYHLNIGLYTCDTRPAGECGNGERLSVTNTNSDMLGDILPLATITVN